MPLISPKPLTNYTAILLESLEECRRQSALASSADRADMDLMNFLDQILIDTE